MHKTDRQTAMVSPDCPAEWVCVPLACWGMRLVSLCVVCVLTL